MSTLTHKALLNKLQNRKKDSKGFTLIELLIVVVILGVLSAIALPAFINQQKKAVAAANNTEAMALARACAARVVVGDIFTLDADGVPTTTLAQTNCEAAGGSFAVSKDTTKATGATATVDSDGAVTLSTASTPTS